MFRLHRLPEDDTIFLVKICTYLRMCSAVSVLVALGRFLIIVYIVKNTHVQVYYNVFKNYYKQMPYLALTFQRKRPRISTRSSHNKLISSLMPLGRYLEKISLFC